jgi:hypothetical protein
VVKIVINIRKNKMTRKPKIVYAEKLIGKVDMEYDEKLAAFETIKDDYQLRVHLGLFTKQAVENYCFETRN